MHAGSTKTPLLLYYPCSEFTTLKQAFTIATIVNYTAHAVLDTVDHLHLTAHYSMGPLPTIKHVFTLVKS